MTVSKFAPSIWQRICMRQVLDRVTRIQRSNLKITFPDASEAHYGDNLSTKKGELRILSYQFFPRIVLGGDVGLGEAYVDGLWDSPDVAGLFELFILNRDFLDDGDFALTRIKRTADRIQHFFRDNSIKGSRKNIPAHYDLGNDFYKTFLDQSMMYSCGIYKAPDESLETAQKNKKREIIDRLQIGEHDHVLEIGCGWGGFAIEAVRKTGCRVTGVTLSPAQKEWALTKVKEAGLEDRIDIQLKDYRHIDGQFDRIVSIEMLEAVGHRWLGHFFQQCDRLLKPNGKMAIQTITVPCDIYDYHRRGTDWIRKHIFPGGHLPSLSAIRQVISGQTSLAIHEMQDIGVHYADTLRDWRLRFIEKVPELESSFGLCQAFQRKWEYYLASCEAGFSAKATGNLQIFFDKKT